MTSHSSKVLFTAKFTCKVGRKILAASECDVFVSAAHLMLVLSYWVYEHGVLVNVSPAKSKNGKRI